MSAPSAAPPTPMSSRPPAGINANCGSRSELRPPVRLPTRRPSRTQSRFACDFVIGDTMSPGDEVAHYGFQVSARPLRLLEGPGRVLRARQTALGGSRRGQPPGVFAYRWRQPQHRSTNAGSGTRVRGGRDERNRRRPGQSATTKHPSSARFGTVEAVLSNPRPATKYAGTPADGASSRPPTARCELCQILSDQHAGGLQRRLESVNFDAQCLGLCPARCRSR